MLGKKFFFDFKSQLFCYFQINLYNILRLFEYRFLVHWQLIIELIFYILFLVYFDSTIGVVTGFIKQCPMNLIKEFRIDNLSFKIWKSLDLSGDRNNLRPKKYNFSSKIWRSLELSGDRNNLRPK